MGKFTVLDEGLYGYLREVSAPEHPLLVRLRRETEALPEARMQVAAEQAQFMQLLVRLLGAACIVEVGTFTGYSSLAMALALPPEGRLVTCDVSEEWTRVARRYWRDAGVAGKISLRLGEARGTLEAMLQGGEAGSCDLAFIDADKENYTAYLDCCGAGGWPASWSATRRRRRCVRSTGWCATMRVWSTCCCRWVTA